MEPTAQLGHDDCTCAEVDQLLVAVTRDGFALRYCNGYHEPTLIVGTYDWGEWVDVVVLRGIREVVSARIPVAAVTDIFEPEVVVWAYEGDAKHSLQALLDLPHPAHPFAPTTTAPAPPSLHVPNARQIPVTIRPPSALASRARHGRLGAALLAEVAAHQEKAGGPR